MSIYISLLRGINVGGQKKILMADLKALYESAGFKNVTTYVQSGNVVFESPEKSCAELEKKIENAILKKYGFEVSTIIRDTNSFKKVIGNNPYSDISKKDPVLPYVIFLKDLPGSSSIKDIEIPKDEKGEFKIIGSEIYLNPVSSYGRTKLNNVFFEKKLKVSSTARNWKTVMALFKVAAGQT